MVTTEELIDNLITANAKHIAELTTEEEVKQRLNSLLWTVAGFKQSVDEVELDKLANDRYPDLELSYGEYESNEDLRDSFKAGYRKALYLWK